MRRRHDSAWWALVAVLVVGCLCIMLAGAAGEPRTTAIAFDYYDENTGVAHWLRVRADGRIEKGQRYYDCDANGDNDSFIWTGTIVEQCEP